MFHLKKIKCPSKKLILDRPSKEKYPALQKIDKIAVNQNSSTKIKKSETNFRSKSVLMNNTFSRSKFTRPERNFQKQNKGLMLCVKPKSPDSCEQAQMQDQSINGILVRLTEQLIENNLILVINSDTYHIKKPRFQLILSYLIEILSRGRNQPLSNELFQAKETMKNISTMLLEYQMNEKMKQRQDNQRIISHESVLAFSFIPTQHQIEKSKLIHKKLQQLTSDLAAKILGREQVHEESQILKKDCEQRKYLIYQQQKALMELQRKKSQAGQQLQILLKSIETTNKRLEVIKEDEKKILSFVSEQNQRKILKDISTQYINIQENIYEYASYLQSNQMANDLQYESHPFREMEKLIFGELKDINRGIMNSQMALNTKQEMMRDYVLKIVDHYKRKDLQIEKLIAFRTKCINNFVEHMKTWLNNWELKKQFLVNLRQEYAFDQKKCFNLLQKQSQLIQSQTDLSIKEQLIHNHTLLTQYFEKISNNYRMGNSFY